MPRIHCEGIGRLCGTAEMPDEPTMIVLSAPLTCSFSLSNVSSGQAGAWGQSEPVRSSRASIEVLSRLGGVIQRW